MDITRYEEPIRSLHESYLEAIARHDPAQANRVVRRILTTAGSRADYALCGYCHTLLANVAYFQSGDYKAFLRNLKKAAQFIMRDRDDTVIKSIYYLVAVDALNNGMYDIAYSFVSYALDVAVRMQSDFDIGILEEMAGFVLISMGEYERAQKITRSGVRHIAKEKSHPYHTVNMLAGYFNEGVACLALNRIGCARTLYDKAEALISRHEDKIFPENRFQLCRFGAQLALAEGDTRSLNRCMAQMEAEAGNIRQLNDDMQDIFSLGRSLGEKKKYEALGRLVRMLSQKKVTGDVTRSDRMFADLKVMYYSATGDARRLNAAYRELDEIYERMERENRRTYLYAQELIRMAERLKAERDAALVEHEDLVKKANTDALTGLGNRHALNRHLEEAFEAAYAAGTTLAVVVIDVNDLKMFNDTYGHTAGDEELSRLGRALAALSSDRNIFAGRYGGDEFLVIFSGKTDTEILESLEDLQDNVRLSLSMGVCNRVPKSKNRVWDYLSGADEALYALKRMPSRERAREHVRFHMLK